MIRFVDINTGDVYNGDKPYVHWFDNEQSVGLNYSKTFLLVTDESRACDVVLDSECFALVDDYKLQQAASKNINGKDFFDLSEITSKKICLNAVKTDDLSIFQFTVIAKGKYIGEVRDEFTVRMNATDYTYIIGADFYDENEALGVNLANFGQEISQEIQRAVYEKNIYEDKPDYILINRKYKEILNEYVNIIANKGSYKSLINSLNWFEYGDLVKIYEFWRHGEPNKSYLSKLDITQYVNNTTEQLLFSMQKTTYIAISCALQKIKEDSDMSDPDYAPGKDNRGKDVKYLKEPVPELEKASMLWSRNEMSLKMVLLGNFFATYFMPIHLDLIHSTIEDVVYTNTIKMTSDPFVSRFDTYDAINKFRLQLDDVYHLTNVETWTNINTPFGFMHNTENSLNQEDEALDILGVDTEEDMTQKQETRLKTYMLQHFKGIGAVIPFNCTLYSVFGTNVITEGEIKLYKNGTLKEKRTTQAINHAKSEDNTEGKVYINFNILIQEIGKYKVQLVFRRSDGARYIKVVEFVVDEENNQTLEMYKLVPLESVERQNNSVSKWMQDENFSKESNTFPSLAQWMMDPVRSSNNLKVYTQFLSASRNPELNCIKANRVIIIRVKGKEIPKLPIMYGNFGKREEQYYLNDDMNANRLNNLYWITLDRYGRLIDSLSDNELAGFEGDKYTFLIGVDTDFITDKYNPDFKFWDNAETLNNYGIKYWVRDMFIPYFYKLERVGDISLYDDVMKTYTEEQQFRKRIEENTYTIKQSDVVCFLPNLSSIRRPKDFQWKFVCKTTNDEITPLTYRSTSDKSFPTVLAPLFGRYDFAKLPDAGYYDVTLNYKLDDAQDENQSVTVSSQFIVEK